MTLQEFLLEIARTPSPSFEEGARAALIARNWAELGLHPELDAAGNVIARLAGTSGPRVCLAAHLDTVFPADTRLDFRFEEGRLVGPGIGDNAASLSVLTNVAGRLVRDAPPCQVWLAATTGEEGLGDLRGAKHLLEQHARDLDAFVAVDGYLGLVVDRAVGVRRYQATYRTPGGHSWGNAGVPSAIHALGEAIHDLYHLPLQQEPRATLNVGTVQGGTSVNSIAPSASLLLDLRSIDSSALEGLDAAARTALGRAGKRAKADLELRRVGDRPAGETDNRALLRAAGRALDAAGLNARSVASSTDANAAVPYRLPAIGLGVYRGGNAHRLDEWVDPDSLAVGASVLERFVREYAASPRA